MNKNGPICHPHGIRGYGDPDYSVVLVGIAPGRDEIERTKRPFTGASGKLLDALLSGSGWSRDKIYATNTICWWNNAPTPTEIEGCGVRFRHELSALKPKLVITAGAIANETVMGHKRKKGSRGSVVWSDRWKAYILDTHHPSYALQAQSMDAVQDILRDLEKIPRILDWPTGGDVSRVIYSTVETREQAQRVLDNLPRDGRVVSCDIETSSLDIEVIDAFTDQLLCFVVSYDNDAGQEQNIVFPQRLFPSCVRDGTHTRGYRHMGTCPDPNCPVGGPQWINWPVEDVRWTFQAGQNDIAGLYQFFGVRLPLREDTQLMSVCCDERPGHHGLKENAREYLAAGWYNETVKPFYKGKMHLLKSEQIEEYNAKDGAYTKRLVPIHRSRMEADDTSRLYERLLVPAMDTFIDMQIRGINVDQNALQELAYSDDGWFRRYLKTYRDLQLEAQEIGWPTDDLNFNSSPQMRKLFFEILGISPTKWSKKTGAPSLDKETLDKMDHPFAAKIRAYRTLDTMVDYVLAVYNHIKLDGLLHPSANVATTRTGRTSYRDPAMQTIPKDYTVGADYARLREIIVPHNPDTHEIIEADYNQIEVWVSWFHSQDPVLLEHLESGDVHSATAEGAFQLKRDSMPKSEWGVYRQNAKKIRFGLMYGEGAEGLSRPKPVGIGGTRQNAQKFVNNFWNTYPTHFKWTKDIQRQVLERGFIRTASGRVMRFPVVLDHKQLRQAVNFPIQADATDYNLLSMIELAPLLRRYNSWIILNVHDALVIEADRRYRSEILALLHEVMTKPKFDGYPGIGIEVKVGDNLGNVKELKHV